MKMKRTSLVSLFVAVALVVSVTTAFATSAQATKTEDVDNEGAFDLLEESITYDQGVLSFTVPDTYASSDSWHINVAGRLEDSDGFSSSMHYFTTTEWIPGKTYGEQIGGSAPYFTELFLDMELGEHQRSIDLLPYVRSEIARDSVETEALLQAYTPFGLTYETDPATGELRMHWQGKPVHSVYDEVKAVWIANSMRGLYLGPDAVDLEAVYEQGKLAGLRETQAQPVVEPYIF